MTTLTTTAPVPPELGPRAIRPGDPDYDAARAAWNLEVAHQPALVVRAESTDDIRAAVRYARAAGLGVGVLATGHGTGRLCDGVLINTSRLRSVEVDPVTRRARVGAGAIWADVLDAAAPHGLVGLMGSSPRVGVVGYTLGGGFGWLGRRYGLAAHSVTRAQVVLADGDLVTASPSENAGLFWGLPGSAGNLGVVTELEFALAPVASVYGGNLYYPLTRTRDVLGFFADWSRTVPDEVTAAVTFRSFPPLPTAPEALRGRSVVSLRAVHCGDPAEGQALVDQARAVLGPAVADTYTTLPSAQLDTIGLDPVIPLGARTRTELLRDLDAPTIAALLEVAGPDARSPLAMLEIRLLGGALAGPPGALSPLARTSARFSLNAIGLTTTPVPADTVRAHLARVSEAIRPLATGDTYVNFLDLDQATPDRMRAAYTDADWARMVALKTAYDPDDLFRFTRPISKKGPIS